MARKCSLYHFETEFEEWKEISISSYKFLWFVQLHEISQRVKCSFSFWSRTAPTSLNAIAHLQVIFTFLVFSSKNLLLEFPVLPAHGALMLGLLSSQPLHDAMDVEAVAALTPHLGNRYPTMSTYGRAAAQDQDIVYFVIQSSMKSTTCN